eukprot:GGOE01056287.1.p1 GENE.GGOE01056287.1~~GGOE01056287.1.p1  ORF type:complete len:412 (-),score=151.83 GGOE01056287.1:333-1523(-)
MSQAANGWTVKRLTALAPVNIAFIKYWGKRDEALILPLNDSYSITLSTAKFRTKTTVMASDEFQKDELWLNGKEVNVDASVRLQNVLTAIRSRCSPEHAALKIRAVSENNFPTAAGMASSASGYCCLVYALAQLFGIKDDISAIARIGSGSACRSVYGGFVKWLKGEADDGSDSVSVQGVPASHWPDMEVLVLVCKATQKDIPSTEGMRISYETSPLMKERIEKTVPERMEEVHRAILDRDIQKFATITMLDSDNLRDVCITSNPVIDYWTAQAKAAIRFINEFNDFYGEKKCGYTFDAGSNAFIFTTTPTLVVLFKAILHCFPTTEEKWLLQTEDLAQQVNACQLPEELKAKLTVHGEGFVYIFHSKVGDGPCVVDDDTEALIAADGTPLVTAEK